jgi:hypothetical protein
MFARDAGVSKAYLISPVFAALVFSLRQDENWLRSSHNCWYFLVVFLLAALSAVQRRNGRWNLAGAAGLALCATLSLLNGILTWPIVLLALILRGDRRLRDGLSWVAAAAVVMTLFFAAQKGGTYQTTLDPPSIIRFALAYLGAPLASSVSTTILAGVAVLAVSIVNAVYVANQRRSLRPLMVWVSLLAFAASSAIATAHGRAADFGVDYAVQANRYVAVSTLATISAVALAALTVGEVRSRPARSGACVALAVTDVVFIAIAMALVALADATAFAKGVNGGFEGGATPEQRACLRAFIVSGQDECLGFLYWEPAPDTPGLFMKARRLAAARLTVFREPGGVVATMNPDYAPGEPIVIEAPLAAQHASIVSETGGARVAPQAIFHVLAPAQVRFVEHGGDHVASDGGPASLERLRAFAARSRRIWYLQTLERLPFGPVFSTTLEGSGFRPTRCFSNRRPPARPGAGCPTRVVDPGQLYVFVTVYERPPQ